MFTGIIETRGVVAEVVHHVSNVDFWIESTITNELRVDQSVAHNGVCLTVVEIDGKRYRVTAVSETLVKTSLGRWKMGDTINIERALRIGDRLDGHLVQGHVDATGECIASETRNGSWIFGFRFPEEFAGLVIEKGSICLNGVSLTLFDVGLNEFSVAVIPYTYDHTNFQSLKAGDTVNIEFDVLGKYLLRHKEINQLNG
jgi:riboflavin synthase